MEVALTRREGGRVNLLDMSSVAPPRSGELQAVEVICDLLLGIDEGDPPTAFFGSLCEAVCRLTSLTRAVLFSYDPGQRRVRALGAHGLEVEPYLELHVTIDSVPVARESLQRDEVLEVVGGADFKIPAHLRDRLAGLTLVCTPMQAAGRCVGVVIGERDPAVEGISEEERLLLKTLGKAIAMAVVAREVTRYHERSRQLQQRIRLAQEIHEAVVQRLFGVSLALASPTPLAEQTRRRCADEVERALADLRAALRRPLGEAAGPTGRRLGEELARQREAFPKPPLRVVGDPNAVPQELQEVARAVAVEGLRNARKHAQPTFLEVGIAVSPQRFVLTVENDGVPPRSEEPLPGIGLHLLSLQALSHGGRIEFGAAGGQRWRLRLTVPRRGDEKA